jgi:hypothetical protein
MEYALMMIRWLAVLLLVLNFSACQTEAHQMTPPRIEKLFEKTRPVCFGRFVVDVPVVAEVLPGSQAFGTRIESLPNDVKSLKRRALERREEIAAKSRTIDRAEVHSLNEGPTLNSWTLRYWKSDSAKAVGLENVVGFLAAAPHGFVHADQTGDAETPEDVLRNLNYVATHLRARDPAEVPTEPGVCLDVGFIADDSGQFQEIFGIGFRFPELPDASFSISSNKNAQQGDSFEARLAEAARSAKAEPETAAALAKVKTLRQGKHKVQQGEGSEALFKRPVSEGEGHWHEFQFEYAGKRFDHHNPPWDATLFTGVVRSDAGAAPSSLSDEEAIALWGRLMSSVRLRVLPK